MGTFNPHRVGQDKKRYYYSNPRAVNLPNGQRQRPIQQQQQQQSPLPQQTQPPYVKKPYHSYSHNYHTNSSIPAPQSPLPPLQSSLSGHPGSQTSLGINKPSRYDPHTTASPTSFVGNRFPSGSRYHHHYHQPNSQLSSNNSPATSFHGEVSHKLSTRERAVSTDTKPTTSRYSGSRYNTSSSMTTAPSSSSKHISTNVATTTHPTSRYRPLSADSTRETKTNTFHPVNYIPHNSDRKEQVNKTDTAIPATKTLVHGSTSPNIHKSISPHSTIPERSPKSLAREEIKNDANTLSSQKVPKDDSITNKLLSVTTSNPHSLGSSLINSVAKVVKKSEVKKKPSPEIEVHAKPATIPISKEKVTKMENDVKKSGFQLWTPLDDAKKESLDTTEKEFESTPTTDEYEYIFDPQILKTDFNKLRAKQEKTSPQLEPLKPSDACIFPLPEAEQKLWELKNQSRQKIIQHQKYLLKAPIKTLQEYPSMKENLLIYQQAIKPILSSSISKLSRYETRRKLQLKKKFLELNNKWQETCQQLDNISNDLRKNDPRFREELEESEDTSKEDQQNSFGDSNAGKDDKNQLSFSGISRRRNRADFVDDNDIEDVLLQIDPDYKHHQRAANIPAMIINPVEKYSIRFKDVNNLITDKDKWSSRVLTDGIDTFTEHEHALFVDAYLTYPKKFGKISHAMGGLRTPEECVLHYYRTKTETDYKKLIMQKNKKRKSHASNKRRKKKEKSVETDNNESTTSMEHTVLEKESTGRLINEVTEFSGTKMNTVKAEDDSPQVDDNSELLANDVPAPEKTIDMEASTETAETPEDKTVGQENTIEVATNADITDIVQGSPKAQDQQLSSSEKLTPSKIHERDLSSDNAGANSRKKAKHNGDHKSSYWSVRESNLFPDLLKRHGSQWSLISDALGTKSTTMVRNYYQRNAAQLGWKIIVEEADAKRNATSSGSVQQSQILIQAEQFQTPLSSVPSMPSQQKPALGLFSNRGESDAPPAVQSFGSEANKVWYPHLPASTTSSSVLPPPRLPSIQLYDKSSTAHNDAKAMKNAATELMKMDTAYITTPESSTRMPHYNPTFTNSRRASSIRSILNDNTDDKNSTSAHFSPFQPSTSKPTTPVDSHRPGNISSLLNDTTKDNIIGRPLGSTKNETVDQTQYAVGSQSRLQEPLQQRFTREHPKNLEKNIRKHTDANPPETMINFTRDPLAALAAVASAPEAMMFFAPNKGEGNNGEKRE